MANHKPGEMDITEQQRAFDGFITWTIRISAAAIGVLIFLAIFNS